MRHPFSDWVGTQCTHCTHWHLIKERKSDMKVRERHLIKEKKVTCESEVSVLCALKMPRDEKCDFPANTLYLEKGGMMFMGRETLGYLAWVSIERCTCVLYLQCHTLWSFYTLHLCLHVHYD